MYTFPHPAMSGHLYKHLFITEVKTWMMTECASGACATSSVGVQTESAVEHSVAVSVPVSVPVSVGAQTEIAVTYPISASVAIQCHFIGSQMVCIYKGLLCQIYVHKHGDKHKRS